MKKLLVIGLAVLMVAVFVGMASANDHGGWVPARGERGECHGGGVGALVKVSEPFWYSCNGEYVVDCPLHRGKTAVDIDFKFRASVAQWLKLDVSATRIDWKVLKPGEYWMSTPIVIRYKSNGDLVFHARGFTNLIGQDQDVIETFFRFAALGLPMTDWIAAPDLNSTHLFVPEDQSHNWNQFKMNMKILVGDSASACEYYGRGTIQVILAEQKPWIARVLKL